MARSSTAVVPDDEWYLHRMRQRLADQGQRVAMAAIRQRNPYYITAPGRALFASRDPEILLEGPAGTGKTRTVLEYIHACCQRYPKTRALLLRKTRESLTESVLFTFEDLVLGPGHPLLRGPIRNNRQHYHYPTGSTIICGGLDKAAKIMSTEYDLIYVAEATEATLEDWESCLTRLRNGQMPYQQAIADCNPGDPYHWLNARPEEDDGRGGRRMRRVRTRHHQNPRFYDQTAKDWTPTGVEYIRRLDQLTGARHKRLRRGLWVAAEGAVYEDVWDDAVHIVPEFDLRRAHRFVASMDFGHRNPGVLQVWAIDGDGSMYLIVQHYHTLRLPEWWRKKALSLHRSFPFAALVADPSEPAMIEEMRRAGLPVVGAKNDIVQGIQHVEQRLAERRLFFVAGSLLEADQDLIDRRLPRTTEQEFAVYAYPKGENGKPVKEHPISMHDHGMDAMRYAVMHLDAQEGARLPDRSLRASPPPPRLADRVTRRRPKSRRGGARR